MRTPEPLIFEISKPGRRAYSLPGLDVPAKGLEELLPEKELRKEPAELPEVSEVDLVRHFTRLSQLNHGVDKVLPRVYNEDNPKVNEDAANLRVQPIHPMCLKNWLRAPCTHV